jgi:hypothetical protein
VSKWINPEDREKAQPIIYNKLGQSVALNRKDMRANDREWSNQLAPPWEQEIRKKIGMTAAVTEQYLSSSVKVWGTSLER